MRQLTISLIHCYFLYNCPCEGDDEVPQVTAFQFYVTAVKGQAGDHGVRVQGSLPKLPNKITGQRARVQVHYRWLYMLTVFCNVIAFS